MFLNKKLWICLSGEEDGEDDDENKRRLEAGPGLEWLELLVEESEKLLDEL